MQICPADKNSPEIAGIKIERVLWNPHDKNADLCFFGMFFVVEIKAKQARSSQWRASFLRTAN
jgi:hypothetical protein